MTAHTVQISVGSHSKNIKVYPCKERTRRVSILAFRFHQNNNAEPYGWSKGGSEMQVLTAYRLEAKGLTPKERSDRALRISPLVDSWLASKGVENPTADAGLFRSLTPGSTAKYSRQITRQGSDFVEELFLVERVSDAQVYLTRLVVASLPALFAVCASVVARNVGNIIAPAPFSARCPGIIRSILRDHGPWTLNGVPVPTGTTNRLRGDPGGSELSRLITSQDRALPLVAVSDLDEEQELWDGLDKKIAFDLAGLASVVSIDQAAAWSLSEQLGRNYACYNGAVRLYWPAKGRPQSSGVIPNTIWTADRLLAIDPDNESEAEERFRSLLRRKVMEVAAVSIHDPREISDMLTAVRRKRLTDLEGKATEVDLIYKMANSYADEVETLKAELDATKDNLAATTTRAENAEALYEALKSSHGSEEPQESLTPESDEPEIEPAQKPIELGEVRFYKKRFATPKFDVLVRVADCGHNQWETTPKAEKAKKGVERLEGRGDWSTLQHCQSCKGGGMWRVKW